MRAADDDLPWRPRPSPERAAEGDTAADRQPELAETLAALEGSLRDVADQVAGAREKLGVAPPPRPEPPPDDPGPPGGRARLREGPLGHLFRSTLDAASDPAIDPRPPIDEPLAEPPHASTGHAANGHFSYDLASSGHAPADPADPPSEATWIEPRVTEVEPRRSRIVANCERELGVEHPDTLWAVHDLGAALAKAGEAAPARRLAARLVAVRNRTLGPEHPHTIRAYQLRGLL